MGAFGAVGWVTLVGALALSVALAFRALRRRRASPRALPGRWRIVHVDDGGHRTVRVIRPLGVHPESSALIAWCELRNRQRGFMVRQIESAVDMRDGRRIDVGAWVAARRPGSRAESRAGGLGASTVSPASLGQAAAASARRRRR